MSKINFVNIPSGTFKMGATTDEGHPLDKETPQVSVSIDEFQISDTTITNEHFKEFVDKTNYTTTAETYGGSFVFHLLLDEETKKNSLKVERTLWWYYVKGASWKHPFGPDSNIDDILDHPVVHISYFDALAFCEWGNYRLPSEAEWEYAARAGSEYKWPWGDTFLQDEKYMANIFQGDFPHTNTEKDGFLGTCPAKYFSPNKFGLYNVIGNVWEWCMNPRYLDLETFKTVDYKIYPPYNLENVNDNSQFATRGGSFLCHPSYCNRYRLGARNGNSASSTASNCGFRVCK